MKGGGHRGRAKLPVGVHERDLSNKKKIYIRFCRKKKFRAMGTGKGRLKGEKALGGT